MFPGQGAQYPGMGKDLFDEFSMVRALYEQASDIAGMDMAKLCFESDADVINQTDRSQPALFLTSIAAFRLYEQMGLRKPDYAIGQSLGEITALCAAGALPFEKGFQLALERGRVMQQAALTQEGAMMAVIGVALEELEQMLASGDYPPGSICISNHNSLSQYVVSGCVQSVNAAGQALKEKGKRVVPLKVNAAFHSPLMAGAQAEMARRIQSYVISEPNIPVLSNVTGQPHTDAKSIRTLLPEQIVQPVLLSKCMRYAFDQGVDVMLDIGPGISLSNLAKQSYSDMQVYAFQNDLSTLGTQTAFKVGNEGAQIPGYDIIAYLKRCQAIAVTTRNRNFENEQYQSGVIQPYRMLQEMQRRCEKEGTPLAGEDARTKAYQLLCGILDNKLVPKQEKQMLLDTLP